MINKLNASDVLHRYQNEDLPEFVGIKLDNVNQRGNFGDYPLHVASIRGIEDEVIALLKAGADINAKGEFGNTPLHAAIGQRNLNIVKILIGAGALTEIKNEFNDTPLDSARLLNFPEIENLLRSK